MPNHPIAIEQIIHYESKLNLICVDDIHLGTEKPELEHLLFRLYNYAEQRNIHMIWAINHGDVSPFSRRDLNSRLKAMLSIDLLPYTPAQTLAILMQHLQNSQSSLSQEVCQLLIHQYTRNLTDLINKAKEIEQHACSQQRKVTLKMCKELIGHDLHQLD